MSIKHRVATLAKNEESIFNFKSFRIMGGGGWKQRKIKILVRDLGEQTQHLVSRISQKVSVNQHAKQFFNSSEFSREKAQTIFMSLL